MFIDKIKNAPDKRLDIIKNIISSEKKLFLYGTGVRAQMLTDFLHGYNIDVFAYIVDDLYYQENVEFRNKKVYKFSEILSEINNHIILIAFQNFERADEIIKNNKSAEIYYIDDPYDFYKMDYDFILKNEKLFSESYDMMSDELSKEIFTAFINGKISDSPEELCRLRNKEHYQYDYSLLGLDDNEVVVDCGAFTGDTVNDILSYTKGKYKKIIAFEPDEKNCSEMKKNIPEKDVTIVNKGVWNCADVLKFHSSKSTASSFNEYDNGNMSDFIDEKENMVSVPVISIDELIDNENVTFIKMDIEGSEMKALEGAKKTIQRCFPKLAICVYHRVDDFITIPQYINKFSSKNVKYKFYMRHHAAWMAETVLYAIPENLKGEDI